MREHDRDQRGGGGARVCDSELQVHKGDTYCVDEFHDSFHWKAACGADSVNIVIKRH